VRQRAPESTLEVIGLIDRFIDGKLDYDFEWDDFISWKNETPQVEKIRNQINQFGNLLSRDTMEEYCLLLVAERNRLASLLNREVR
jgi:hypothetical protein